MPSPPVLPSSVALSSVGLQVQVEYRQTSDCNQTIGFLSGSGDEGTDMCLYFVFKELYHFSYLVFYKYGSLVICFTLSEYNVCMRHVFGLCISEGIPLIYIFANEVYEIIFRSVL